MTDDMNLDDEMDRMEKMNSAAPQKKAEPSASTAQDWRAKLAAIKAKAVVPQNITEDVPPTAVPMPDPEYPTPSDVVKPLEEAIKADLDAGRRAEVDHLKDASEKLVNAEALYAESQNEKNVDRERFKRVFINKIQTLLGMNLDEIENVLMEDHLTLFDTRVGIQAALAFRSERMKDLNASERAERMKKDFLFKPNKEATKPEKAKAEKKASTPKAKKSPLDLMADAMRAKGIDEETIKKRLAAFQGLD